MKRITVLTVLGLFALACANARATPQAGTPLAVNGTNHYVHGFDLRKDMADTFRANHDKLVIVRSCNWGGCNATLEVRGKKLYLTSLDIDRPGRPWPFNGPSVKTMFGVTIPKDGMFADWFTGTLEEPIGESLIFYTTLTERILAFDFQKGILIKTEERRSEDAKRYHADTEAEKRRTTNNTSDDIHQPASGLSKPSR